MSADKLSAHAIPCVFLGFVLDAPGWQFFHPTSRRVLPSQDVTFDKSVPFYRLFPYRSAPLPPSPLFLAPGPPPLDPFPPQGPVPSGVSQIDPPRGAVPSEVAIDSGAARDTSSGGAEPGGAETGGAAPGGSETGGAETGGAERGCSQLGGAEPRDAETGGAKPGGAEPGGAEPEGSAGASLRLSSQQLCEWLVRCARLQSGATGAGGGGVAGAGGAGVTAKAGVLGGTAATGPGGARTRALVALELEELELEVLALEVFELEAPAREALELEVLGVPSSTGLTPPLLCPPPDQSQHSLQPASPLPAPSPYTEKTGSLTERREPASRPASPVCTGHPVPRPRPPPLLGTHAMTLRPSSVPLHVPLPAPPESSLPESVAASALDAKLVDFAAACRLDNATTLIAESTSTSPPSIEGECALGTDILEEGQEDFECLAAAVPRFASMMLAPEGDLDAPDIPTPRSYADAMTGPYSSQWQAAMDAEMASRKSTGTYVDKVPPCGTNIVNGRWIFRMKRPPGSSPAFKAHYVTRGFSQRQGVDYFRTFSPTPKMTTLLVLLHIAA
ncbi:unnamed protein product [Closterium sp. NIES-53]